MYIYYICEGGDIMEKEIDKSSEKSECFKTFGGGLLTAILESLLQSTKFDKDHVKTIDLKPYQEDPKK